MKKLPTPNVLHDEVRWYAARRDHLMLLLAVMREMHLDVHITSGGFVFESLDELITEKGTSPRRFSLWGIRDGEDESDVAIRFEAHQVIFDARNVADLGPKVYELRDMVRWLAHPVLRSSYILGIAGVLVGVALVSMAIGERSAGGSPGAGFMAMGGLIAGLASGMLLIAFGFRGVSLRRVHESGPLAQYRDWIIAGVSAMLGSLVTMIGDYLRR